MAVSESVTSPIVVSAATPQRVDLHVISERVLRLVIERKPVPLMPYPQNPQYLLAFCTETLECGHSLDVYPQADKLIAKRRNCPECAVLPQKKPVQSVRFIREKRNAVA